MKTDIDKANLFMRERLDYIDEMKGFAILLVVMGHLFIRHTPEGSLFPMASIIYSFHMSFFFFLSGYVNEKTNGIDTKGIGYFVKKKSQSLLIPYAFWTLIAPIFLYGQYPHNMAEVINLLSFFPNNNLWFLPTLFIFMMLYLLKHFISRRGLKHDIAFSLVSIGIFFMGGGIFKQYHLVIYGIYWASFLLGEYLSKYDSLRCVVMKSYIYGICATILCIAWKIYPLYPTDVAWKSMANLLLCLICSYTACVTFYNFFRNVSFPKWLKWYLQETGKLSLVVYIVPIVILPQTYTFPQWMPDTLVCVLVLLLGTAIVMLRYAFGKVVYEVPILRYIMFGKK